MITKILKWGAVVFLAYYLLTNPAGAAHSATHLLDGLKTAGNSLGTFANNLGH